LLSPNDLIKNHTGKNTKHVFLINGPIVSMVARMTIDALEIPEENMVCVSIRRSDVSLVANEVISPEVLWYDRYILRLFNYSLFGKRILKAVTAKSTDFILYAAWMSPEVEKIVQSKNCIGHVYIEEGQLTYYKSKEYALSDNLSWGLRKKKKMAGDVDCYYRDDALAYVGILHDAFPAVPAEKRVILDVYDGVLQRYKTKLDKVEKIGLMPPPHRIPREKWNKAIELLVSKMPDGGVIKLHPGFNIYPEEKQKFAKLLTKLSSGSVTLCDDKTILELEFLVSPKHLFGARSSVSRYAEAFGSMYEEAAFDGYEPPNN